jgi:hypothetical protein
MALRTYIAGPVDRYRHGGVSTSRQKPPQPRKRPSLSHLGSIVCLCLLNIASQAQTLDSPYGKPDDLPPGVPHAVDTNGNVFSIEPMFTTPAFQEEGLRLVIDEANKVARDLRLPESLPITRTNLTHAFIAPFGYTFIRKRLGNVTTSNDSSRVIVGRD